MMRTVGAAAGRAENLPLKSNGSAIRLYFLLLAFFLASCAAPDTQHQIVDQHAGTKTGAS